MKKIWTPKMDIILKRDYPNHGSGWCGGLVGMRPKQVIKRAGILGLKITQARRRQKQSDNIKRMWALNPGRFSGIDYHMFTECKTREAAYILGLLWADGYVGTGKGGRGERYRISIELVVDDFDVIRSVFDATGKWCVSRRNRKNRRSQACAMVSNKPLFEFLRSCGYGKKHVASAGEILDRIPDDLKRYWWRGFFDGDGCIYINKKKCCYQLSLAGGFLQDWGFAEKLLTSLEISYTIQHNRQRKGGPKGTSSCVRITNKDGVRRFCEYIYGEYDRIGLVRKHKKYMDLIEFADSGANIGRDLTARRLWVRQMIDNRMTWGEMAMCLGVSSATIGRDLACVK